MYQLLFDNGCEYENKNYNDNNKYGTTMSRLQTHDIDNESALILNCKKQYQSKLISFYKFDSLGIFVYRTIIKIN